MQNTMTIQHEGISRETEKAIMTTIEIDTACGLKGMRAWYPKSQIEYSEKTITVPSWLMEAKINEYVPNNSWAMPVHFVTPEPKVSRRSLVMKRAWELYRTCEIKNRTTFSECLKVAWTEL